MAERQPAPHAVASLVLGCIAVATSWIVVGLILGIIGLAKAKKAAAEYKQFPDQYSSVGIITAGRICSIVGIALGAFFIVYWTIIAIVACI